jgi:uncharacterized protein YqeY
VADTLKSRLQDAVKQAMRDGDRARLGTLRMVMAAIQQLEVDERRELDDTEVLAVLDKQVKQRRESVEQYRGGGRDDLADREESEIEVLAEFLPQPLTNEELDELISRAIEEAGADSIRDMGKVMGALKPRVQGRADMGEVSRKVKARLGG